MTPLDRLADLKNLSEVKGYIGILMEEYAWFLEAVGKSKTEVLNWIGDENARIDAFKHSDRFTNAMFETARAIAEKHGYLRYLVI